MSNIVSNEFNYRLSESCQTITNKYCWLNEKFEMETPWFMCRDYFNEFWLKYMHDMVVPTIYGMSSKNISKKYSEEYLYIGLMHTNYDHFYKNFEILNTSEVKNGFKPTEIIETNHKNKKILKVDIKWMTNPTLFYIWSLYIRLCFYENKGDEAIYDMPKEGSDYRLLYGMAPDFKEKVFYEFSRFENIQEPLSVSMDELEEASSDCEFSTDFENTKHYNKWAALHNTSGIFTLWSNLAIKKVNPYTEALK